jgi:septin family protein
MDSSRYSIASGLTMGRRRHNANQFNIMVTGHSLSGKSSFIRTFQHTLNIKNKASKPEKKKIENQFNDLKIIDNENSSIAITLSPDMREDLNAGPEIETFDFPPRNIIKPVASDVFEIIEDGERINLRLIDTPGLPIPIHNISKNASDFDPKIVGEWCTSILLYIENQYEITLLEESRVRRNRRFPDSQVHVCLYLIDATTASVANGLTAIDIITIQKLAERVNLVPCLSKADLMTVKQLEKIKKAIRNDIDEHNLPIYMFDDDEDDDQDIKDQNAMFRNMIPFVLVNAEETEVGDRIGIEYIEEDGKHILGRQYTWGTVDVENPEHCDFCDVKTFLLETHINELKQLTKDYYYESWRTNKLMEVKGAISKPIVSSGLRQSAAIPSNANITPPASNHSSPMVAPQQLQQPPQPQQQMQVQPLTPQQVALMAANNSYQPTDIDEEINIPEKITKPHRRTGSRGSVKSFNSTHSKHGAQVMREE